MKAIYPVTYLIASDNPKLLKAELLHYGLAFKEIEGRYTYKDGTTVNEYGFAVVTNQETLIKSLAFKHNQESILRLDAHRNALLIFKDGSSKYIGEFKGVTETEAKASNAYTVDPSTGVHYVCK